LVNDLCDWELNTLSSSSSPPSAAAVAVLITRVTCKEFPEIIASL